MGDMNNSGLNKSIGLGLSESRANLDKSVSSKTQHNESSMRATVRDRDAADDDKEGSLIYLIRNCFRDLLAIENGLELQKRELALRHDFTLAGAFNLFTGYS